MSRDNDGQTVPQTTTKTFGAEPTYFRDEGETVEEVRKANLQAERDRFARR